jgi:hypothetical protein
MPLPLPDLDNRSYADLIEAARALIPTDAPFWTNHNPSDPGIALTELFAWLTEMLIYRGNRVPDAHYETFLKLLNGTGWTLTGDLGTARRESILALRERYRAATCEDFEYLVTQTWPGTSEARALGDQGHVWRAYCVRERNLDLPNSAARDTSAPAHISLIVMPDAPSDDQRPQPTEALRAALWEFLDERRLLTMRHHVVGPDYVSIAIAATLFLREDARPDIVPERARDDVRALFHPRRWPFGRDVYISEVYELLEKTPGVDHITDVEISTAEAWREQRTADGSSIGITLKPHELVAVNVDIGSFTIG